MEDIKQLRPPAKPGDRFKVDPKIVGGIRDIMSCRKQLSILVTNSLLDLDARERELWTALGKEYNITGNVSASVDHRSNELLIGEPENAKRSV